MLNSLVACYAALATWTCWTAFQAVSWRKLHVASKAMVALFGLFISALWPLWWLSMIVYTGWHHSRPGKGRHDDSEHHQQ